VLRRNRKRLGYLVTGKGWPMALTNAEKQRRWRAAHTDRRRTVQRVASMLMRMTQDRTQGRLV